MNQAVRLQEILHPKIDILFVALNPPDKSNKNGHYFSSSWSFWNLLLKSGLIIQSVKSPLSGDDEVFRENAINYKNLIYGITDLCYDIVQTQSSKVFVNEKRVQRILSLLQNHKVKNLCLMHSKVGKAFEIILTINRNQKYGLIGRINDTNVFEMPFHNASIKDKESYYKKLK
jgi:G:T/U-mismatch repair DNA glycosylase